MITTSDIANILYTKCLTLGIADVRRQGADEWGELTSDRVMVIVKDQSRGDIWNKCYAEVNICVPDFDHKGTMDLVKLEQYEHLAKTTFGVCDGQGSDWYSYSIESQQILHDNELCCGYVNTRIKFEVLSVGNNQ